MSKEHASAVDEMRISQLVDMQTPERVLDEVETIVRSISPKFDFVPVQRVFNEVVGLFRGEYPGYCRCDTEYHNLQHTTDVLLAMARLLHGAVLRGGKYSQKDITLGLIGALFHDSGYIRTWDDHSGTGAKYTLVHIRRSIGLTDHYFSDAAIKQQGFSKKDSEECAHMLRCTGFSAKINEIPFETGTYEQLGKMLGTADLLGQMADRAYLERLLFLYYEFVEGQVRGFTSEFDLLRKTLGFYDIVHNRFSKELGRVNSYMLPHFADRWGVDRDLYADAIEKNRDYLKYLLTHHQKEYRAYLKRSGVIEKLDAAQNAKPPPAQNQ
ncbi:MAG: hypothetical protein V1800_10335 [Candidatus Latescibacterota bacterium]